MLGGPAPRAGHIAVAVTHEGEFPSIPSPQFFPHGEQVSEDLAWMLVICERVDGWNARERGEFFNIALRVSADNCSVNHPAQNASGVLNGLSSTELNIVRTEKEW